MPETLNADGPTVSDYAEKVQVLQQQLKEAHLLHSQLYGTSDQDSRLLIASAYKSIASIDLSQCIPSNSYAHPNNVVSTTTLSLVCCAPDAATLTALALEDQDHRRRGGTGDNRHRGHTPKIQTHHPPTSYWALFLSLSA